MADSPFPRLQAAATILTPVLLGIGGLVLSNQQRATSQHLEEIAQTVNAVQAMEPYIDLLADGSPQKAKMAAYALYKLNPNDQRGAVYMILAADREESNEVLRRLARDDPNVRAIVSGVIGGAGAVQHTAAEAATPDPDEVPVKTEAAITGAAVKISRSYTRDGWMYLGTFTDGQWGARQIAIGRSLPEEGKEYKVVDDTYLRVKKPSFPLYKLADAVGVVKKGDEVHILELDSDLGKNRVWARVRVVPAGQ